MAPETGSGHPASGVKCDVFLDPSMAEAERNPLGSDTARQASCGRYLDDGEAVSVSANLFEPVGREGMFVTMRAYFPWCPARGHVERISEELYLLCVVCVAEHPLPDERVCGLHPSLRSRRERARVS